MIPASLPKHTAAIVVVVALVTLGAYLDVPVPLSPVPVSLQTLFVALAALVLPWRTVLAAMCLYLGVGAAGLPVFADGKSGLGVLVGPTGGFLVGFVVAATLTAVVVSRTRATGARRWLVDGGAALALHAVVLILGVAWLAAMTTRTLVEAAEVGALPFLPGAVVKSAAAAALAPLARATWRRGE